MVAPPPPPPGLLYVGMADDDDDNNEEDLGGTIQEGLLSVHNDCRLLLPKRLLDGKGCRENTKGLLMMRDKQEE